MQLHYITLPLLILESLLFVIQLGVCPIKYDKNANYETAKLLRFLIDSSFKYLHGLVKSLTPV